MALGDLDLTVDGGRLAGGFDVGGDKGALTLTRRGEALVVRASTLWYAFRKRGPNVVAPEKEIIPTWDGVKSGRDPVQDWVLAQPPAGP